MSIQPVKAASSDPNAPKAMPHKSAEKLTTELDAIESKWKLNYAGKRGYNPFVCIKLEIDPLRKRIAEEQLGADLDAAVAALATKEPVAITAPIRS